MDCLDTFNADCHAAQHIALHDGFEYTLGRCAGTSQRAQVPISASSHQPSAKISSYRMSQMFTRLALLIIGAVAISACSLDDFWAEREAKKEIAGALLDPDSADFRSVTVFHVNQTPMVCGEVNGKNAFGAKGGFQRFLYRSPLMRIGDSAATNAAIYQCCSHLSKAGTTGGAKSSQDIEACAALHPPMVM